MNRRHSSAIVTGAALIVAAALGVSAQDEGVKLVQQLVKKAHSQVESVDEAKLQLQKTMDAYNALFAPDVKDRRDAYKTLQKEMATSDKKRAEVSGRSGEMNVEADKLFKSWEASTASIQSPDLRRRSQERLKKTQDRFSQLRQMGQQASGLYGPFMKTLQDQVTYLGHDLNPGGIASLKPDADKLNAEGRQLYAAIDRLTAAANDTIAKLSAE
jgi:hypothetical protein